MKIELKNTDFKLLYEFLRELSYEEKELNIHQIVFNTLKPQYDKAFNKYKGEKQKFEVGEKVKFRFQTYVWANASNNWNTKIENLDWIDGTVEKVFRRADGKYMYVIKYKDEAGDEFSKYCDGYNYTNRMTEKNIRKNE